MLFVAIALSLSLSASSDQAPDVSGSWVVLEPATVAGQEWSITQTDATLRIERHSKSGSTVVEYRFAGQPRATADPAAHWDEFGRKSNRGAVHRTASWDKTKLVLTENIFPGQRFQRALHLNRDGQLVLEVRTPNVAADAESGLASDAVLEPKRILFKRK